MVTLEQVEKLCERANISYDEARTVLEATNGDMLEAIITLEKQGRIKAPKGDGYYNSANEQQSEQKNAYSSDQSKNYQNKNERRTEYKEDRGETFHQLVDRFFKWCCKIVHLGNINTLEVAKDGNKVVVIPVTVLVLLLIFTFWITVPIIIIGIFFGYRYTFHGPDIEKTRVNNVMDSVSEAADNLKKEVKDNHLKHNREDNVIKDVNNNVNNNVKNNDNHNGENNGKNSDN